MMMMSLTKITLAVSVVIAVSFPVSTTGQQQIKVDATLLQSAMDNQQRRACWKGTVQRGVGRPLHECSNNQMEQDAGLCYPRCNDGFQGAGPLCHTKCKNGFTDAGVFCSRGGGVVSANNDKCPWYDKCGVGLSRGCSTCPDGYNNDGCTCRADAQSYAKESYSRGIGKPLACNDQSEDYDNGLCYDKCPNFYTSAGPVCWQRCPAAMATDFGAVCCASTQECNDFVAKVSQATFVAGGTAVLAGFVPLSVGTAVQATLEAAGSFTLPPCTMQ